MLSFPARLLGAWVWLVAVVASAEWPPNLVAEGIPAIAESSRAEVGRFLEFRAAIFQDWHPRRRAVLVTTRFGSTLQLHDVRLPGGDRHQLTFQDEPVASGQFEPGSGASIVFSRDSGGGESFQLYRLNMEDGLVSLLTDGRSRNTGPRWSPTGRWLAYASTRRNGRDTDLYVVDPARPETDRRLAELAGGGWSVLDWSRDERQMLVQNFVSVDRIDLHLMEVATGQHRRLNAGIGASAVFAGGRLTPDGNHVITATDQGSEFRRLARLDLRTGVVEFLGESVAADVEDYELAPDGRRVAWISNEDGISVLRWLDLASGKTKKLDQVPRGVISDLRWHPGGRELGFTLNSARSPSDVYSISLRANGLTRWTESETGGLDASRFVEPRLVRVRAADGVALSGFLYRPDPRRFPGPRPVLVSIHGGPEAQSRPIFQARWNYLLERMGVAILYPNVRGSTGYGKKFLALDDGLRREDAVRDVGTFLDWIGEQPDLDSSRIGAYGGSYGGFMVLSSLAMHGDRLRCGVDLVGISNFLSFLRNTQEYRRDLRRAEYGDEREPAMAEFLERISPLSQADRIGRPLLVVQGRNDPRVAASESEQMVRALRSKGGTVWYLMANDEGHGFAKKKNADLLFLTTVRFLEEHLLK